MFASLLILILFATSACRCPVFCCCCPFLCCCNFFLLQLFLLLFLLIYLIMIFFFLLIFLLLFLFLTFLEYCCTLLLVSTLTPEIKSFLFLRRPCVWYKSSKILSNISYLTCTFKIIAVSVGAITITLHAFLNCLD